MRNLTWNACLTVLAVGVAVGGQAGARTFGDAPPTRGLYKPTAYTLAGGEFQIQFFAFSSPMYPLSFLEFEYGLSDAFQLGLRPVSAFFGDVRLWGKYRVGTSEALSLAIPFGIDVFIPSPAWKLRGGWVLSWRASPLLTFHPGIELSFSPAMGIHPYLGADLDLGRILKLVVEVEGEEPHVTVGLLAWLWEGVLVQVDSPLPSVSLRISVSGRF